MNTKSMYFLAAFGLLCAVGILSYVGSTKREVAEPIKIGAALGLTGDASAWGEASLSGAQLAVSEINAQGGVNGQLIELVVEDTKSSSKDAVSAVSKLKNVDGVKMFLATWLDVYQGPESLLGSGEMMISPDSGIEAVNGSVVHNGVFSNWHRTEPKSDLIVEYMQKGGIKTLYIVAQNDSYYTLASKFMEEAAAENGIEVVGTELLNSGVDMKTVLAKIKSTNPDAVWFAMYDEEQVFGFLKNRKHILGDSVTMYGDEFVQQNYTRPDYAGLLDGFYYYAPRTPDKSFYDAYVTLYDKEPVFGASTSYDAVYMIAQVLKNKPTDIDAYMRSTTFKTVSSGEVTFDAMGGIETDSNYFTIKQIVNGQPVEVK